MRFNLLLFLALFLLGSPSRLPAQQPVTYPNNPAVSSPQGVPHDSATNYFPASAAVNPNRAQPSDTSKHVNWGERMDCAFPLAFASQNLFAAKAPVLSNYFLGNTEYRFTWLRSFHPPAMLTLRCTPQGATLQLQILNKPPGMGVPGFLDPDEPGLTDKVRKSRRDFKEKMSHDKKWLAQVAFAKAPVVIARDETIALTQEQVQQFVGLLAQTEFWTVPSCQPRMVIDGAYWILEAHEPTRYHTVFRHSPGRGDPLRSCCDFLLNLSPLKKEERY